MAEETRRGAGDRWLAGDPVPGVRFAHHALVELRSGPRAGARGRVLLLLSLGDDPAYLVSLGGHPGEVRVRQSALQPAAP